MTGPPARPSGDVDRTEQTEGMAVHALQTTTLTTPAGPFSILLDGDGVAASGFTADPEQLRLLLPPGRTAARLRPGGGPAADALAAYFAGDLAAIADVVVSATGTAYQQRAWAALRAVPAGIPVSYAELAARCGSAAGARAAGSACGRNPTAVVVPCHRVVRGDGSLGGFAWGLHVKRWLLDHERRHAAPAGTPHPAGQAATPASRPPRPPARARTPAAGRRS